MTRSPSRSGGDSEVKRLVPPSVQELRFWPRILEQVSRLHVIIQCPRLELADPDSDQLPGNVVTLGQRVQRLTGDEFPATCRLNATLWERCLAMASFLQKPDKGGQINELKLSTRRGALHCGQLRGIIHAGRDAHHSTRKLDLDHRRRTWSRCRRNSLGHGRNERTNRMPRSPFFLSALSSPPAASGVANRIPVANKPASAEPPRTHALLEPGSPRQSVPSLPPTSDAGGQVRSAAQPAEIHPSRHR